MQWIVLVPIHASHLSLLTLNTIRLETLFSSFRSASVFSLQRKGLLVYTQYCATVSTVTNNNSYDVIVILCLTANLTKYRYIEHCP